MMSSEANERLKIVYYENMHRHVPLRNIFFFFFFATALFPDSTGERKKWHHYGYIRVVTKICFFQEEADIATGFRDLRAMKSRG